MRREIKSAVNFLANMGRSNGGCEIDEQSLEQLSLQLRQVLSNHYRQHWHPDKPWRGSGYRCLRINHKLDPLIVKAGHELGMEERELSGVFPKELTLWIDPGEVSYRIGENGTICVLYESKKNRQQQQQQQQQLHGRSPNLSYNNRPPFLAGPAISMNYHQACGGGGGYLLSQQPFPRRQQQHPGTVHVATAGCRSSSTRGGGGSLARNYGGGTAAYVAS